MIQVWKIDKDGYFTGESDFLYERDLTQFDITEAITVGYIKAKWNGSKWIEGATEEEIRQFKEEMSKPPEPTEIDRLKERIELLENENADLLLDSVNKDIRLEQNENDIADVLLVIGGM